MIAFTPLPVGAPSPMTQTDPLGVALGTQSTTTAISAPVRFPYDLHTLSTLPETGVCTLCNLPVTRPHWQRVPPVVAENFRHAFIFRGEGYYVKCLLCTAMDDLQSIAMDEPGIRQVLYSHLRQAAVHIWPLLSEEARLDLPGWWPQPVSLEEAAYSIV